MKMFRFLFPTPFTPQPLATMNAPYGANSGTVLPNNMNRVDEGHSGVNWRATPSNRRYPINSGGFAGPERYVQGTVIKSGDRRNRW